MKIQKEYWYVIATGILSGLIVFGGQVFKNLGFSLMELSVLLYFPTFFFLLPFLQGKRGEITNLGNLKLIFWWSLIGSLTVITQFGAIVVGTPVAIVALLLYTQPIWTIIITKLFLKASVGKRDIISIILVLAGLVFLIKPWQVHEIGSITGILIALLGGLSLSGWVIIGSFVGKSKIDPYVAKFLQTTMAVLLITIILTIFGRAIGQPEILKFTLIWPLKIWLMIIIFNLLTQPLSHILYLKGSKVVPAKDSGIILLLEPVSGAILAALFLGQAITLNIFIGGILILVANYFVLTKKVQATINLDGSR